MPESLAGLRILNTRPAGQAQVLTMAIQQAGGQSISLPLLEIKALADNWSQELEVQLAHLDYAIFVFVFLYTSFNFLVLQNKP